MSPHQLERRGGGALRIDGGASETTQMRPRARRPPGDAHKLTALVNAPGAACVASPSTHSRCSASWMLALAQRLRLGGGRESTRQRGTRRDMSEAGMQSLVTSPPSFSFSPRSCPLLTRPPTLTPTRILTNKTLTPWQEMRHIPNEELLGGARGRRYPRGRVASTRVRHVRCVPPPARRLSACRSDEVDRAGPCRRVDSAPICAADDGARGCVTLALAEKPPHGAESVTI
ncbi:hypothetical protein B0H10DRAFT_2245522 [Mycena sp. CBHHK59/15]|nr:hypothetical protein B0H10DRAFT_2245522 [Mycena sp. CBHHK59/15]